MTKLILLIAIRLDETQAREIINENTVAEYAQKMTEGVVFPPVVLFCESVDYWIGDGHHRVRAARLAGMTEILAEVRDGTALDAIEFAVGANDAHGLPRSPADKRKSVRMALANFGNRSDSAIAVLCRVSRWLVSDVRTDQVAVRQPATTTLPPKGRPVAELRQEEVAETQREPPATRVGRDGKKYRVTPAKRPESATKAPPMTREEFAKKLRPAVPFEPPPIAELYFGRIIDVLEKIPENDPDRRKVGGRVIEWIKQNFFKEQ